MQLGNLLLTVLDPFKLIRNYFLKPLAATGIVLAEEYRQKTHVGLKSTKNILLRLIVVVLVGFSIIWASIFMYAYFYYSYMPTVSHVKDVHLNYRNYDESSSDYPADSVVLTKTRQVLMVGQPYRVVLYLEMPESENNTGMFTVCARLHDHADKHSVKSCRIAMLHYKSNLLKTLSTLVLAPFYILGFREEKQVVAVELFTHFEDNQDHPATVVSIALLSQQVQFYGAQLHITANFSGLRYLMFNWPILSAIIGITTNLFFILIVCVLSWYHWDDTEWLVEIKDKYQQIVKQSQTETSRPLPESVPKLSPEESDNSDDVQEISSFKEDLGLTS